MGLTTRAQAPAGGLCAHAPHRGRSARWHNPTNNQPPLLFIRYCVRWKIPSSITAYTGNPLFSFFPKRFLSWGFKTLFASVSSCEWKRLLVSLYSFPPAGLCRRAPDRRRSSWRGTFCLSCFSGGGPKPIYNPHAARRWDFIYTKNSARPGSDFTYTINSARLRSDFT